MKNLFKAALIVVGATFASGISAADAKPRSAAKASSEDRLHCFAEKKTGSNLRRRICVTPEEQERRRKEDQQAVSNLRRSTGAGGASRGRD